MKTVLMIAYYFPPLGGAGVQRTLKFVKYLPTFNYESIVLTPNSSFIRYKSFDNSLKEEIPKETKIYNTFIIDLNWIFKILYGLKLKKLVNFINGRLIFPDYQKQWLPFAKRKIKHIIKKDKIDLVFITSPPYSTQLLGKWIKNKYNLPIVSDFRDPFTFNHEWKNRNYFNKCFKYEENLLNKCNIIIANTKGNKKKYIEKFNIPEKKIEVINNGFDEDDFKNIKVRKRQNRKIIFSHIGQFYGDYNAMPFILALNKLKNIELRFIGSLTQNDKKLIKKFGLSNFIKTVDYCSHKKALQYNQESDFLLLIIPNENWNFWIPGKTFEYINSNKKILAIIPQNGSCAEIIRNTKTGVVVSPSNIDKIAKSILDFIEDYGNDDFDPDYEEIQKYDRKALTQQLALVFDNVLSNELLKTGNDEVMN